MALNGINYRTKLPWMLFKGGRMDTKYINTLRLTLTQRGGWADNTSRADNT